jgi:transposase
MLIIGCDFHPSGQQVYAVETETGEIVADRWLAHEGEEVRKFYRDLGSGARVGVEASGNMLWFERLLEQCGHELKVGDAGAIRAKDPRKQKHDRRDAKLIWRLLVSGEFPEIWVPSLAERDLRQLLVHRDKLVRMRTRIKCQLQHLALNQGLQKKRKLWTQQGRKLLEGLELEPWTKRRRDDLLQLLDSFEEQCKQLDRAAELATKACPKARLLMTHVGVGPIISLGMVLTLGDVSRFSNSRRLISYLGLNPSEESSGDRHRLGSISKQGSSFMRFLLVQGAQTAARADDGWARQYRRLAVQKHRGIAKVMVARKLAVRMYWMLRTNTPYPEVVVRMRGSSSHPVVQGPTCLSERPASPAQASRKAES